MFTTPTTVIVDDEIITISGKSGNTPSASDLRRDERHDLG